jgi:hypothetical protein
VQEEQERKYLSMMDIHSQLKLDFQNEQSIKKLKHIEELIKTVYKN